MHENTSRLPDIQEALHRIEQEHNVQILYACESGSRAWGFASPDSDYDVRFVYVRPLSDYLSINETRDVIELPIDAVLDVSGWDLRKALRLLYKSNAPLLEWLQSPIVYTERDNFAATLLDLAHRCFSPRAMAHHYLSMAHNALSELSGETVRLKKYFYALRPLLAAQWIVEQEEIPPMEFCLLRTLLPETLLETVEHLLEQKTATDEKAMIRPVPELNEYIRTKLELCTDRVQNFPRHSADISVLNEFFRSIIQQQI
jgi:predicted nucleotidyltransferase